MSGRPVMVTTDMDLAEATLDAIVHLRQRNEPPRLFMLGDAAVRVEPHPDDGRPITRDLTVDRVMYHLADSIEFVKATKNGQQLSTIPPVAIARNVLASPTDAIGLPQLVRIVETPVFGRNGELCSEGYNPASGVLFQPADDFSFDEIPSVPSAENIAAARDLICNELLGDFPFVGSAERAHAVAALLLPFVRELIDGPTPLHLIEKPSPGTGASLLADVLLRPALGRALPAMAAGRDDSEWRKRLTAVLSESPAAVLFDNVPRLGSDALAAALTATTWKDRVLGMSRVVHLPVRCVWLATANNPGLNYEIVRRTVRIRLDAGTDRPWLRNGWRHPDLSRWATEHRAALVRAALTLAQQWVAGGKPAGAHPKLGTYESWSHVIGGILWTSSWWTTCTTRAAFAEAARREAKRMSWSKMARSISVRPLDAV